jgi:CelD/BcsL family acetyltransferase involved in cellulose biosynthesis
MTANSIVDMGRSLEVIAITSLEALAVYGKDYDRFIESVPAGQGVFYSRAWLEAMMPLYCPKPGQLLFLLAIRDGTVVGLAPLCFEESRRLKHVIRRLTCWGALQDSLMVEANFLTISPDNDEECLRAFRDFLFQSSPVRVDCLDLRYFRTESPALAKLRQIFPRIRFKTESMESYQVDLGGSFEAFLGSRSKSLIKQLGKLERALARDIGFTFESRESLTEAEFSEIAELHSRRQQELVDTGRSRFSVFGHSSAATCYRVLLGKLTDGKRACFFLLKANESIIAFLIAFRAGTVMIGHLTAFDSEFAKYSPGKLLHLKMIESEIRAGRHSTIDLMPGRTKVKTDFCSIIHPRVRALIVNPYRLDSLLRYAAWQALVTVGDWKYSLMAWLRSLPERARKEAA